MVVRRTTDLVGKTPLTCGGCLLGRPRSTPANNRGVVGEVGVELLRGDPPHPLPDTHSAQQALVLVHPTHRHLQPLSDLVGGEVAGRHGRPMSPGAGSGRWGLSSGWLMSWRAWSTRTWTSLRRSPPAGTSACPGDGGWPRRLRGRPAGRRGAAGGRGASWRAAGWLAWTVSGGGAAPAVPCSPPGRSRSDGMGGRRRGSRISAISMAWVVLAMSPRSGAAGVLGAHRGPLGSLMLRRGGCGRGRWAWE